MLKLSEIVWGDDSAEKDPNLLEYFVLPTAVKRLGEFNKTLIVGRKGSGKSALLKKLRAHFSNRKNTLIIDIQPSFHAMKNILAEKTLVNRFAEEIFFQYAWQKYLLYKAIVEFGNLSYGKYIKGSYEFARNIAKKDQLTSLDFVETIADIFSRLKLKTGKLGDLGLTLERDLKISSDVAQYIFHIKRIIDRGNFDILYFIDDLDLLWSNTRASNNILLGLLACANMLMSLSKNIHLFIGIREDVYKLLLSKTQHSDKYRNVELLRWEKEELKEILEERIKFNFKGKVKHKDNSLFYHVFPEMIHKVDVLDWMVERTLGRPRELIQLSRIYTEKNESEYPNEQVLLLAERTYSEWKLQDLCNEYMYQYPGMMDLFNCWRIVAQYNDQSNFLMDIKHFEFLFLDLMQNTNCEHAWLYQIKNELDYMKLLLILYEIGFVGDVVDIGMEKQVIYSVNTTHRPIFNKIKIHPCFHESMKVKCITNG